MGKKRAKGQRAEAQGSLEQEQGGWRHPREEWEVSPALSHLLPMLRMAFPG